MPASPPARGEFLLGVQTHLSGLRTKRWSLDNWRRYLCGLIATYPKARIFLLDTDPQVEELCISPQIQTTRNFKFIQSLRLVEQLDFLVALDSWSKYVAAVKRIPQLIIVPDQRPEGPHLTAHRLANVEFSGLMGDPLAAFIGLSGTRRNPSLTLPSMADLSVEHLLEQTHRGLKSNLCPSRF